MELTEENSIRMANMGFLCALFVVVIHVWGPSAEGTTASRIIWGLLGVRQIAVPYFFLAAGFFLSRHFDQENWWGREMRKRMYSLFVPFVVWSVCWQAYSLLVRILANCVGERDISDGVLSLVDIQLMVGMDLYHHPLLPTLWFVRALLVFVAISPILKFLMGKKSELALLGSFVLWGLNRGYGANVGNVRYFLYDYLGLGWIFFFIVGIYLNRMKFMINIRIQLSQSSSVIRRLMHLTPTLSRILPVPVPVCRGYPARTDSRG